MVVYDLKCSQGHRFEGWFDDLPDLKRQLRQGLIACPACGDAAVEQVPAGFAIAKRGGADIRPTDKQSAGRMMARALNRYLQENFDDVGPQFAKEALKMHYGVSEPRNIRGVSTAQEEQTLKEEGVSFFKVGPQGVESGESSEED